MPVTLTVNGTRRTLDVPDDMPLLWVLREVLDLKGPKFGCGIGQCGACTVHVNGNAVRSCNLPVAGVANANVVTVEGLSADGTHPLQLAWQELDVAQCGYCQAGQLMTAAALLRRTPRPSDADIDRSMNGNICRCATYHRIREGIHRAASIAANDDANAAADAAAATDAPTDAPATQEAL
jgi:isoquinoline 1-oxidoreductase alpha subunit